MKTEAPNVIHAEHRFRREVKLTVDMVGQRKSMAEPTTMSVTSDPSVCLATWQVKGNSGDFFIGS